MSHILHVDAGDFLALGFNGDARRSRVLLKKPLMRKQDMCLWPQVELNALRTQMYSRLCNRIHTDAEIMDIVSDAMLDINVWYDDWNRIFDPKDPHSPWLLLNMQVQRCWGVTMALCRAIRTTGVENVDVMSPTQKQMLAMAQEALWQHLGIITQEPRLYLQNLRFAMDFVWAKCVFCYLLLLKLTMLLPNEASRSGNDLIDRGHILLSELGEAGGGLLNGHRSNTGKVYLQLLETGIDKFSSAIGNGRRNHTDSIRNPASNNGSILQIEEGQDSFVPEQFVFDWDFPGLTLFSSSVTDTGWLDDILLEALNGTDEFMGFGWSTTDTTN
ncbi:C6 zinc finger domain protein [Metarhizium anisopliae]|nr:C6 zinc finger domain protein [Metarhizium anisopliae]